VKRREFITLFGNAAAVAACGARAAGRQGHPNRLYRRQPQFFKKTICLLHGNRM
jgi:hypothetical protein